MSGMLMMMLGGGLNRVFDPIPLTTISDLKNSPSTSTAGFSLESDGSIVYTGTSSSGGSHWHRDGTNVGIGSNYFVRCTLQSGTSPSGSALGTWLGLSADAFWNITRSSVGTNTCTLLVEISMNSSGTIVVATKTISMSASVEA